MATRVEEEIDLCICDGWNGKGWSVDGHPCPDHPPNATCKCPCEKFTRSCVRRVHGSTVCDTCQNYCDWDNYGDTNE